MRGLLMQHLHCIMHDVDNLKFGQNQQFMITRYGIYFLTYQV